MDNKLIELLTEHCRKHYWFKDDDDIEIDTDSICFHLYHKWKRCFPIKIETVICKDFGFIKRLVDNEKIEPLWKYIGWETDEDEPYIKFDLVDQYIAYLSIQDNPIEFLISILKIVLKSLL